MKNEDSVFIVCVFLLCVLFSGEPDIIDGVISYLQRNCK